MRTLFISLLLISALLLTGCNAYYAPGANFGSFVPGNPGNHPKHPPKHPPKQGGQSLLQLANPLPPGGINGIQQLQIPPGMIQQLKLVNPPGGNNQATLPGNPFPGGYTPPALPGWLGNMMGL